MLGNRDEASDAAQDAFVRAWRALPNFRGESALGTWLHRIALRKSYDHLRRRVPGVEYTESSMNRDKKTGARIPETETAKRFQGDPDCKGCGLCAEEGPCGAIEMVPEQA